MTFTKVRGTRMILSVDVMAGGFAWHLACGHTLVRSLRPRFDQKSAICDTCRKTAAPMAEPERDAAATKRMRDRRLAAGLCRDCGRTAALGKRQCTEHLAANTASSKRLKSRRRARVGES